MKIKLINTLTAIILFLMPNVNFGQAPTLGTASDFVLFSSVGAVTNVGIQYLTLLTGHVGANSGPITNFGNVDGNLYPGGPQSAACAADLTIAYNQLNATVATIFPAPLLGNGQTLTPGVHSIAGATTLNLDLTLDGLGNPNAVFIFKIQGPFSTNANSKVKLINGTKACNVFWKVEGLVDMATGTTMRGTIIANNAAINMATGDTLEGRALSTNGAITVTSIFAYTPIGCGSPVLVGPLAPNLVSTACYALFSSIGPVTNNLDPTLVTGDVGTNSALTTGFNPLFVTGMIHPIPDASTAACATDLTNVYNYLNALPADILLIAPTLLGHNLVLTPHTYLLSGATALTDTLYLNAEGNANAVFVIQINGAFTTSTNSRIVLTNGTQAKNVYWKIDGAVDINSNSIFNGTIISAGAINLQTNVTINGRALTINGALNATSVNVTIPLGTCGSIPLPLIITEPTNQIICEGSSVSFSVAAVGTGLTYQWRKGIVNLINGGNISGATTATLTINPTSIADAAVNYNVIVSSTTAPNDTSINVSLIVNTAPIITMQPTNQLVCPGNLASFSITATGTGISYQWKKGLLNLINGGNISGATTGTLTINPVNPLDTASNYYVVITGTCLPNDTSINVSLRLNNPIIISQPTNQIACPGSSVNFTVASSGTGLTYQWRKGIINLINGGNISGAISSTLTINPVGVTDVSANYNVVISGACAPNDTSNNASLILNNPNITSQPTSQVACSGSSVSFTVATSGTGLNYQWRKGIVNLINGGNISGATSATLTINPVSVTDVAANYNVVISGACTPNDTSNNVSLILNNPNITSQPTNQVACPGNSVSFTVASSGTGLNYQWRKGIVNLINGGNISGSTSATLTINPVGITDVSANYNVIVSGTCAPNDTSNNASLILNNPTIINEPSNQSACAGSSVSFSVSATGTGLSYQWRKGIVNLINGGNISGATSATLTINPVSITDAATNYNVVITGACAPNDTSINVSLIIGGSIITSEPTNKTVCVGNSVSFSITASGTGLTYQWKKGTTNLINGGNIFGATTATLTINPVSITDAATNYNVVITGACAPNDTSINVTLSVTPLPIAVASSNSPVCVGGSINLSAQTVAGVTYSWSGPNSYSSTTQNPVISSASINDSGTYSLTTNNSCGSANSTTSVVVNNCSGNDLSVVKTVSNTTPIIGNTIVFTITATNNGPNNATGVEVNDVLQNGYSYVSSTSTTGNYNPSTEVWTIGNMSNGATETLIITVTVVADGNYVNTAIIYGNQTDLNMANNVSSIETYPTDFFIPEGFSPNGDGINDDFVIRGISNFPDNKFDIFNRWGNKVFEANPYKNTWDGKATKGIRVGGDELPVGTYFYILDLGDGTPVYKGTIYLNR